MWRSGVRVTPPSRGGRKNPETPSLPVCSCETVVEQKTLIGSPIRSAESDRLSCGPTMCWAPPNALRAPRSPGSASLRDPPTPAEGRTTLLVRRESDAGGDFPGGADSKEPACRCRRPGVPWVGETPWRRAWRPAPAFSPGEARGQRSLASHIPSMGYQKARHDSARTTGK